MNLANLIKKNGLPLLIIAIAIGLVIYMTKREGFQNTTQPIPSPNKCTIELPLGPQNACKYLNNNLRSDIKFDKKNNKCVRSGTFNTERKTCSVQ